MVSFEVEFLPVLVATVAAFIVGFLWYGPLFGKTWIGLMGFTKKDMDKAKQKGMAKTYIINLIATFVMVWFLAIFISATGANDIARAISVAFMLWIGFIATIVLGTVLWEGKPFKLYVLNVGYWLVTLIVAASIIAAWP